MKRATITFNHSRRIIRGQTHLVIETVFPRRWPLGRHPRTQLPFDSEQIAAMIGDILDSVILLGAEYAAPTMAMIREQAERYRYT